MTLGSAMVIAYSHFQLHDLDDEMGGIYNIGQQLLGNTQARHPDLLDLCERAYSDRPRLKSAPIDLTLDLACRSDVIQSIFHDC